MQLQETKSCSKCKKTKPVTEFRMRGGKQKHLVKSRCNSCLFKEHREWCKQNPTRVREYRTKDAWSIIKRCARHNITPEQLVTKYEQQGGKCLICELAVPLMGSAIDHNHATGEFRGVLCKTCNRALGMFRDSPRILRRAVEYLETNGHYGDGIEGTPKVTS